MDIGFENHNNNQENWLNTVIRSNLQHFLADHERLLVDKEYTGIDLK